MIFEEKKIILKNESIAILKTPGVEDAENLLYYIKIASGETDFLLRYPEEWDISIEKEETWINRLRSAPNSMAITCFVDNQVVGNCELNFQMGMKCGHRATIAIAILQEYWNLGIGSAMFEEIIAVAKERGTEILELEFVEGNERAKTLYQKFGFEVVSERPNMFKLKDGTYRKEFYMQKYLK